MYECVGDRYFGSLALDRYVVKVNRQQRSARNDDPQAYALHERPDPNLLQGLLRKTGPDQKQRRCEASLAEMVQRPKLRTEPREIGSRGSSKTKEENEPGHLHLSLETGTIQSARANFTVVPTAKAWLPYFAAAPTTELVS